MVATIATNLVKDSEKIPASKVPSSFAKQTRPSDPVSPTSSTSSQEELLTLRARNKILTEALAAIKESASEEMKKKFDLVWFAKYRYRYPNHEASKRIEETEEYKAEIQKLRDNDGDFHHGFNTGVLAATRMFKEKADILHVNDFEELSADLLNEGAKHSKKIEAAKSAFPHIEVTNDGFPEGN